MKPKEMVDEQKEIFARKVKMAMNEFKDKTGYDITGIDFTVFREGFDVEILNISMGIINETS